MRICLTLSFVLALATAAIAVDTGHRMPSKAPSTAHPNIPDPDRQGGDTIEDALMVVLPVVDMTGATTGYNDDYDEVCPYSGSTAPDVVYTFMAPGDMLVDVDMFGSTYDTKIYVYDEDLDLVACNDDFYPDYVSRIEAMPVVNGIQYFVVIDGYGGAFGDYVLNIDEFIPPPPCVLECPPGGVAEGEPPLVDDYQDAYNGGCNSPEFGYPFQDLFGDDQGDLVFCGVSGWYTFQGSPRRDTDWLIVHVGASGVIELTADAEQPTWVFEKPTDCGNMSIHQQIGVGDCAEDSMTITVSPPRDVAWLWIGPTTITTPPGFDNEYAYIVWFSGLAPAPVATESASWSSVKTLFR
ncbi:hypothetical protein DRQ32_12025 [bacterium]|nr:MAG: hypothetical protein DRQ32_12025 [bacterium]